MEDPKQNKEILHHLEILTSEINSKLKMEIPGQDDLRILNGHIQNALAESGKEQEYTTLENAIKEANLAIEAKYPDLSLLLNKVAEMLSSVGI